MTDFFSSETSQPMSDPTPSAAPTDAGTPVSTPAAPERTDFDAQLDDFLSRDLVAEMAEPKVEPTQNASTQATPAPAGTEASPGEVKPLAAGAPPSIQAAPANGGTPPAATTQAAPAGETAPKQDDVDPALLLQMFGQEAPASTPAASAPSTPAAAPPAQPAADEVPMPFTTAMQLPPELVTTLFQSEDPVQQGKALTSLMAALGNAVVGYVEQRVTTHHAPRMAQQMQAAQQAQAEAASVHQHFYGKFPELAAHRQIVSKAGEVYLKANPDVKYDESTAEAIAGLARRALQQMGISVSPAAAAAPANAAPAVVAPANTPPAAPYVAGAGSPGGNLETPLSPNDPGSVFDQMTSGWG